MEMRIYKMVSIQMLPAIEFQQRNNRPTNGPSIEDYKSNEQLFSDVFKYIIIIILLMV